MNQLSKHYEYHYNKDYYDIANKATIYNKEIKNMDNQHTYIKDGHEYIKVFRSKTPVENLENQQNIGRGNKGYYYYIDYNNWKNYTKLHIGDVVLFNNGFNCSNPIGLGTLAVIVDIELFFSEDKIWHQVKDENISFIEYSENSVEVCYKAMTVYGDLTTSYPIENFATLDNVQNYFAELLKRKKKMQFYDTKVKEAEQARDTYCKSLEDFKIDGSYDMLYEKPYEGDK